MGQQIAVSKIQTGNAELNRIQTNLVTAINQLQQQITTINTQLSGVSVTVTTAKLTGGGTPGSMTFTNGILTAQVQAT